MPLDLSIANSVIAAFAQGAREKQAQEELEQQRQLAQEQLEREDKRIELDRERVENEQERIRNAIKQAKIQNKIALLNILPNIGEPVPWSAKNLEEAVITGKISPELYRSDKVQFPEEFVEDIPEARGLTARSPESLQQQALDFLEAQEKIKFPRQLALKQAEGQIRNALEAFKLQQAHQNRLSRDEQQFEYDKELARIKAQNKSKGLTAAQLETKTRKNLENRTAARQAFVGRRMVNPKGDDALRVQFQELYGKEEGIEFYGKPKQKFKIPNASFVEDVQERDYLTINSNLLDVSHRLLGIIDNKSFAVQNIAEAVIPGSQLHDIRNEILSLGAGLARQLGHKGRLSDKDIEISVKGIFDPTINGAQMVQRVKRFISKIRNGLAGPGGDLGGLPTKQKILILQEYGSNPSYWFPVVTFQGRPTPSVFKTNNEWFQVIPNTNKAVSIGTEEELDELRRR